MNYYGFLDLCCCSISNMPILNVSVPHPHPLPPVSRCVPFHAHTVIYRDIKTNGSLCFIKTGSSITQVSVFYFSYLTVPCGAAFKLSLYLFPISFSEVWIYHCKASQGPSYGEEFKTCLSDLEKRRWSALVGSGPRDSIPADDSLGKALSPLSRARCSLSVQGVRSGLDMRSREAVIAGL